MPTPTPAPTSAPITVYVDPHRPGILHVQGAPTAGGTEAHPLYVSTLSNIYDPVVVAAIVQDAITVLAVLVAIFVPLITGMVQANRRKADKTTEDQQRKQDKLDEQHAQALRDQCARHQLITILRVVERQARAVRAMPRLPVRNWVQTTEPFIARALQSDIAYALDENEKRVVFDALALAQSQLALTAEYQEMIDSGRDKLEQERISATATARQLTFLQREFDAVSRLHAQEGDHAQKRVFAERVETLTEQIADIQASERFVEMEEFNESQERRRNEIQNMVPIIVGNATRIADALANARGALGDETLVAEPQPERPLA